MLKANDPILVTGGAGFIGSHLCERLIADGKGVICIDDLTTGSLENISGLMDHPSFQFFRHDITTPFSCKVSAICNLACPASPVDYQRDPVQTLKTSVQGTLNTLDLARKLQVPILHASTSEIYGDPLQHPQMESYWGNVNPIGPRACYDEGKRCAETLLYDYHRVYGVDSRVIRIFNTYGPRMKIDDGRVVSNFIVSALRGEFLTVYGDGKQTRSFCYVDDLVELIVRYLGRPERHEVPINAGNPEEYQVIDLAHLIAELIGEEAKIEHYPLPTDDPRQRKPDISLAKSVLKWQPRTNVQAGLLKTIEHFRRALKEEQKSLAQLARQQEISNAW